MVLEMCKSRSGLTALNDSRLLDEARAAFNIMYAYNILMERLLLFLS